MFDTENHAHWRQDFGTHKFWSNIYIANFYTLVERNFILQCVATELNSLVGDAEAAGAQVDAARSNCNPP